MSPVVYDGRGGVRQRMGERAREEGVGDDESRTRV